MSKLWPDEVRSMVDALTRDGVLSQVTPLSATTWRVSVPYADADYGPGSMPWTCNGVRFSDSLRPAVRRELTRVAVLAPRIHDAVPTARVTTTTDGIEVSVGSKSVRWKREKNGWSLGDDLFTSDDRVVEHAKGMAADAAPEPECADGVRMSKPWPDEVRQMVDALMHGGACPSVYGCSDGGWRIHTGRAWADYDTHGNACWWFDGSFRNAAFVLAELLQRSDTIAPAQTLSNRILVAVPTARTVTTDDGIEVTVGSKSVRWKREKRGWSLGDDLFTSDDRVVEHAKGMAADAAPEPAVPPSLLERLREAVPGLTWSDAETCIVGKSSRGSGDVIVGSTLCCWRDSAREPHAVMTDDRPSDDECVRIVTEWYAKTHPAPAAPTLLERLRTAIPSLTWREEAGECIGCDARGRWRAIVVHQIDLGKNQAHLVACKTETGITTRSINGFDAVVQHIGRCLHGDGDEQVTLPNHGSLGGVATGNATLSSAAPQPSPRALDTDALTAAVARAIEEQSERQRSHEWQRSVLTRMLEDAKERGFKPPQPTGARTMTQTKTEALAQTIKLDASEAAWRTAGSQFVKLAREPLVGLLTRHLAPNDEAFRARLAAFLETELGTALLASMLSATLSALPQTTGEVPQKLARELRVRAMADAGDVMADVLMQPLLQVVKMYLQDVPSAPLVPSLDEPQHAPASVDWSKAREVAK